MARKNNFNYTTLPDDFWAICVPLRNLGVVHWLLRTCQKLYWALYCWSPRPQQELERARRRAQPAAQGEFERVRAFPFLIFVCKLVRALREEEATGHARIVMEVQFKVNGVSDLTACNQAERESTKSGSELGWSRVTEHLDTGANGGAGDHWS